MSIYDNGRHLLLLGICRQFFSDFFLLHTAAAGEGEKGGGGKDCEGKEFQSLDWLGLVLATQAKRNNSFRHLGIYIHFKAFFCFCFVCYFFLFIIGSALIQALHWCSISFHGSR